MTLFFCTTLNFFNQPFDLNANNNEIQPKWKSNFNEVDLLVFIRTKDVEQQKNQLKQLALLKPVRGLVKGLKWGLINFGASESKVNQKWTSCAKPENFYLPSLAIANYAALLTLSSMLRMDSLNGFHGKIQCLPFVWMHVSATLSTASCLWISEMFEWFDWIDCSFCAHVYLCVHALGGSFLQLMGKRQRT